MFELIRIESLFTESSFKKEQLQAFLSLKNGDLFQINASF